MLSAAASCKRDINADLNIRAASASPRPITGHLPIRKPKRAQTRPCPICEEPIPLRLLAHHAELELSRVHRIVRHIGSTETMADVTQEVEIGPSSAPSTRRSAVKARKAINPRSAWATDAASSLSAAEKTIRFIKRRRKARNASLRELGAADEEQASLRSSLARGVDGDGSPGRLCPVCSQVVQGDEDVINAHVDSCLAHAARLQEERELADARAALTTEEEIDIDGEDDGWEEIEVEGEVRLMRTGARSLRGTGFYIRNGNERDVEDDVDVDGDDEAVFGDAQFTEGDVVTQSPHEQPSSAETLAQDTNGGNQDLEDGESALRALVVAGKVLRRDRPADVVDVVKAQMEEVMGVGEADSVDAAVVAARRSGNKTSLIGALEAKVKLLERTRVSSSTSSICRICLDPYTEPTVSTGCWHTCCRECWLRCLGSTKLCPMCKRITQASELRRVYL